mmetsp:Transcript_1743/g.2285  ORF Transcript_1743/g.2285 Transcript_1743/m.2285 type:complete len:214 (-) Transcript_1743:4416-5057(-)
MNFMRNFWNCYQILHQSSKITLTIMRSFLVVVRLQSPLRFDHHLNQHNYLFLIQLLCQHPFLIHSQQLILLQYHFHYQHQFHYHHQLLSLFHCLLLHLLYQLYFHHQSLPHYQHLTQLWSLQAHQHCLLSSHPQVQPQYLFQTLLPYHLLYLQSPIHLLLSLLSILPLLHLAVQTLPKSQQEFPQSFQRFYLRPYPLKCPHWAVIQSDATLTM